MDLWLSRAFLPLCRQGEPRGQAGRLAQHSTSSRHPGRLPALRCLAAAAHRACCQVMGPAAFTP